MDSLVYMIISTKVGIGLYSSRILFWKNAKMERKLRIMNAKLNVHNCNDLIEILDYQIH